ncbi:MAG: ScyD/ScyE family protein, partial [Dehalococcoidia bacterium]
MKNRLFLAAALAAVISSMLALAPASAKSPVSAGTSLATGLLSPRGMKMGPDGMIYVAEAGSGGDIDSPTGGPEGPSKSGFTGRISKVDPATGTRTTVVDNLPSNGTPGGDSVGPADVAFIGDQLYYVQTHGGDAYGFPGIPTGVYKVTGGSATLVADIGAYNIANPVTDISSGTQKDIEPGGNPYSMTVRDGAFYVVDGNQNQVMKVTTDGAMPVVTGWPGNSVSRLIAP